MKFLKFRFAEITFRTFPKLLHIPACHSFLGRAFAQYALMVQRLEVQS